MSSYKLSLASNFPADCRIPHLENNLYIYGEAPMHQSRPFYYSSNYLSPYTQRQAESPFSEHQRLKTSQEKYQEIDKRESHLLNPYKNNPHYNNDQFENYDTYHNPLRSNRSNYLQSTNPDKFLPSARSSSRGNHEFQIHQEQEIMRLREIEREKLELEELLNIKKIEKERNQIEKEEYKNFLLKKQQMDLENQRKQVENFKLQQIQETEHKRQTKLEQIELESALNTKKHKEMAIQEYEKTMEMRRREELSRLQMEAIQNPRPENNYIEDFNQDKQKNMKKVTIKENDEVIKRNGKNLYSRNKNQLEHKCDTERSQMNQKSKNKKKYEKSASSRALNVGKKDMKEESGRGRRQFLREIGRNDRDEGIDRKILDLVIAARDNKQYLNDLSFRARGSSSKSENGKIRSVSAKKNEPHYHQPTFSTKVKAMENQSYRFVGAYKTGFS